MAAGKALREAMARPHCDWNTFYPWILDHKMCHFHRSFHQWTRSTFRFLKGTLFRLLKKNDLAYIPLNITTTFRHS